MISFEQNNKIHWFVSIALILIIFWSITKILEKIGVLETSEEKQEKKDVVKLENLNYYFNPLNWDKIKKDAGKNEYPYFQLYPSQAELMAQNLHKAIGIFTDDENAIYNEFRKFKDLSSITQTASWYWVKYKKDLLPVLQNNLNTSELSKIYNSIKNLPVYTKVK